MFNNVGQKMKTIAKVMCWVSIGICCFIGLYLTVTGISEESSVLICWGLGVMLIGPLVFWVINVFLYGMGELVENSTALRDKFAPGGWNPYASAQNHSNNNSFGPIEASYSQLVNEMNSANTSEQFRDLAARFKSLQSYRDSSSLAEECEKKAETFRSAEQASEKNAATSTATRVFFDLTKPVANATPPEDEYFVMRNNVRCADCGRNDMPMITTYIYEGNAKTKVSLCRSCFMSRLTAAYEAETAGNNTTAAARSKKLTPEEMIQKELDSHNFILRQGIKCDVCSKYNKKLAMATANEKGKVSERYICRDCMEKELAAKIS